MRATKPKCVFFSLSSLYNIYDWASGTTLNLVGIIDFCEQINDFKKGTKLFQCPLFFKKQYFTILIENLFSAKVPTVPMDYI